MQLALIQPVTPAWPCLAQLDPDDCGIQEIERLTLLSSLCPLDTVAAAALGGGGGQGGGGQCADKVAAPPPHLGRLNTKQCFVCSGLFPPRSGHLIKALSFIGFSQCQLLT